MQFRSKLGVGFVVVIALALTASASELALLKNGFSVRHEHRQILNETTRLYLGAGNDSFVDVPTADIIGFEPAPPEPAPVNPESASAKGLSVRGLSVNDAVNAASEKHQIDPDLITSVIHAESGFNPHAVSPKGARGLMQLMPQTAGQLGVNNPFDPAANVDGGTRYLRQLLMFYNDDMAKALAAYNAGPARVAQYHGLPPYHETHVYVARVITDFNRKKMAEMKQAKVASVAKSKSSTVQPSQAAGTHSTANSAAKPAAKSSSRPSVKSPTRQAALVTPASGAVHQ